MLLDLSAAFDTVDHSILIERLRQWVDVSGSPPISQIGVFLCPYTTETAALSCGVPQGSVLGPILFALYMLPLSHIISKLKGISYHCYADDIQLYVSFKLNETYKLSVLHNCLTSIKDWMTNNFL